MDPDTAARALERQERWNETEEIIKSRRPMTPEEEARETAAVRAYYDGTPTVEDFLVRAETELRYACHADECHCSATAGRANIAYGYVRDALRLIRENREAR